MDLWIKILVAMLLGLSTLGTKPLSAQADPLSNGIYRIPYADGTEVRITRDHLNHTPVNRVDMIGVNGTAPYQIVAAADGVIRAVVDNNTGSCNISMVTSCADCNNYVWIEHPNGEWTKYTHFITGSVTANGWNVDDPICAGEVLGLEGDIGATRGGGRAMVACNGDPAQQALIDAAHADAVANTGDSLRAGVHLHFEVAIPDDMMNPFDPDGGFINGRNYIPIICDIDGNIFVAGEEYTAGPCTTGSCADEVILPTTDITGIDVVQANVEIASDGAAYTVSPSGQVHHQAGNRITLTPGFEADAGSFYQAIIEGCNGLDGTPTSDCMPSPLPIAGDTDLLSQAYADMPDFSIYPNPATASVTIQYDLLYEAEVALNLVDLSGRHILQLEPKQRRQAGAYSLTQDIGELPNGSYLCVLRTEREIRQLRLVVIH